MRYTFIVVLLLCSMLCFAQEIVVTSEMDDNGADTTLREAIAAAESGDIITFDASLEDKVIQLELGDIELSKSLTIQGLGRRKLTIQGGWINEDNVPVNNERSFGIIRGSSSGNIVVTIEDLTFKKGVSVNGDDGGAMFITVEDGQGGVTQTGTVNLNRCDFVENRAFGDAGGSDPAAGAINVQGDEASGVSFTVNIDNCRFIKNQASDDAGAIDNQYNANTGGLFISNSLFEENKSGDDAGAIRSMKGNATISDTAFHNNEAGLSANGSDKVGDGGAYDNDESISIFTRCLFEGNKAADTGGALFNPDGTLTVNYCIFRDNIADDEFGSVNSSGGALANEEPNNIVNITNSIFENNGSEGGGAIINAGSLNINGCTFSHNTAFIGDGGETNLTGTGGAIANANIQSSTGVMTVTNSLFYMNQAQLWGGGIYNLSPTVLQIVHNSTFYGNSATDGGAVYNDAFLYLGFIFISAYIDIKNCTISENAATTGDGGGVTSHSLSATQNAVTNINDSIVAGNTSTSDTTSDVEGDFVSNGYNLIGIGDGASGFGSTGDQVGTVASPKDPLLGSLANHGGPTATMALLSGSTAIDAGDPSSAVTFDQRGYARPIGGTIDIGAFEMGAFSPETDPIVADFPGGVLTYTDTGRANVQSLPAGFHQWKTANKTQFRELLKGKTIPKFTPIKIPRRKSTTSYRLPSFTPKKISAGAKASIKSLSTWTTVATDNADHVAYANTDLMTGEELFASFPGQGIFYYDPTGTTQVHEFEASYFTRIDINGDGQDELAIHFPGYGLFFFSNFCKFNSRINDYVVYFEQIHSGAPLFFTAYEADGDLGEELAIAFDHGFYIYDPDTEVFTKYHSAQPLAFGRVNFDGAATEKLAVSFSFGVVLYPDVTLIHSKPASHFARLANVSNGTEKLAISFAKSVPQTELGGHYLFLYDGNSYQPIHPEAAVALTTSDVDNDGEQDLGVAFDTLVPGIYYFEESAGYSRTNFTAPENLAGTVR